MLNCCYYCRSKLHCHTDSYGEPLCVIGHSCSPEIVSIDGQNTHANCIICPAFRPSRIARRAITDRYEITKKTK